jgi:hypothetical protein
VGPLLPPSPTAPLATRVQYEHAMVADAEYQLALAPRTVQILRWQISILPAQPDQQAAWLDVQRLEAVAQHQPDVLSDLAMVRLAYQQQGTLVRIAGQLHLPYRPNFADLQTWLNRVASDGTEDLSPVPAQTMLPGMMGNVE